MTKDEALKMAIDFLDGSYEAHKVRKACQEALEQPAQEPVSKTAERDYNFMRDLAIGTENILNEMLSAKPIAWTKQSELDKTTTLRNPIVMWKNQYASIENNVPLYTHPAPSWKGFSDTEYMVLASNFTDDENMVVDEIGFARAIEHALRNKNGH